MKKNFNKGVCLLLFCAMGMTPAMAQTQEEKDAEVVYNKRKADSEKKESLSMLTVKGTIIDEATGSPMGGVRVQAFGNDSYSTLTEENGAYSLDVPDYVTSLLVVVPGYNTIQVSIGKDRIANAKLLTDGFRGEYANATEIKSRATATLRETSSLTVETDIENQLNAAVRSISRNGLPGQGAYMTIRGVNSVNANAQPLIIVDGNIIDPQYDRTSLHEGFYNNLLAGIDPDNIESVEVLKNATSLYGAKGANGVIVITTKRGKTLATRIGVRIYGGTELTPKKLKMLDGNQYRTYLSDMVSTMRYASLNNSTNIPFLNDNPSNFFYNVYHNNTDWQKDMYQKTFMQNYKISVEGGDDVGMYSLSLGYASAEGTQKGNDMSRLNIRFNTDIKITDALTTSLDIAYNQTSFNVLDNGWSENYGMQNIGSTNVLGVISSPMISPYAYYLDEATSKLRLSNEYAGKYASSASSSNFYVQNPFGFARLMGINESLRNPYWIIRNGEGKNKNYAELSQININVRPKYQITRQFSISNRFNYQMNRNNEKYFLPKAGTTMYSLTDLGMIHTVLKTQFSKEETINNDLRLEWKNSYGAHNINAIGGWRYNNYSYSYSYMRGYNNENDKLPNLSVNMQYINYGGAKDNWMDMTYYLNGAYNYANKYFAEATISSQASSRFGSHTKDGFRLGGVSWGLFPSLQLGWVVSNEKWFKPKGVDYLKLTAGVDQSGNDDLDYYAARTYWESQQVYQNVVGLYLKNIENSTIQWETTTKYNVALHGSFLNNRLQAGLDLFWHKTDNLLTLKELSFFSGMNSKYWTNEGSLTNKGFELSANAVLINRKDWKWEAGFTMGHYNNKITSLPADNVITYVDANGNQTKIHGYTTSVYGKDNVLTAVGQAVGSFYGWQTNGVLASNAEAASAGVLGYLKYPTGLADAANKYRNFEAGDMRFVDQNNDGVIDDADRVVIGNPNPDIYGNLYTNLTWKNLRLDVNFKYSLGNDIYNYQRSIIEGMNTTYNQSTAVLNRWTYEGQQTNMPKANYTVSDSWRNNERMSDRWIEDGSYLRLKNVRLTYTLPYSNNWLQGLKVWGEANNLLTITKYLGTDPEMSTRNSVLYQSIDTGLIPMGRSFNIGLSLNL